MTELGPSVRTHYAGDRCPDGHTGTQMVVSDIIASEKVCLRCHLSKRRISVVPYCGPDHPRILFVGEAPGTQEDAQGIPFVGPAGKILRAAITKLHLKSEDYAITNVLKCHPPFNAFDDEAARTCLEWLDVEIASARPSLIVALGRNAARSLLTITVSIMKDSGTLYQNDSCRHGIPVFLCMHPAATLHAEGNRKIWNASITSLETHLGTILGKTTP